MQLGYSHNVKKCILAEVEQRDKKSDKPNETKDSVNRMFQKMNLLYIDELYESACKTVADEVNEKNRKAPFLAYIVPLKSLPQYNIKTWADEQLLFALMQALSREYKKYRKLLEKRE